MNLHKYYGFNDDEEEKFKEILKTPHSVITYDQGTKEDYEKSRELEQWVAEEFITPQQEKYKEEIFQEIEKIIEKWSDNVIQKYSKIQQVQQYRARILPFGSYQLGVSSVDGDIDTVIIAPSMFDRERDFQETLYQMLKNNKKVTNCILISSKQQIITFKYENQDIDMCLSILNQDIVPENIDQEISENIIDALSTNDERNRRSIIGRRNNQLCLQLAGNNTSNYRVAMKALKIWYKAKYISPNRLGYLGGIDIAILCTKIFQLFPNYPLTKILEEFFRIYANWDWKIPIKITKERPISPQDQKAKPISEASMIISQPSYDYQNTSKAYKCNRQVIVDTLQKSSDFIENEIKKNKKNWKDLFTKYQFFNDFQKYVQIDFLCFSDYTELLDTLEMKLVQLFNLLGDTEGNFYLHPFPHGFTKVKSKVQQYLPKQSQFQETLEGKSYFIGIKKDPKSQDDKLKLKNIFTKFISKIENDKQLGIYYTDQYIDVKVFQVKLQEIDDIYFPDAIVPDILKNKVKLESELKEIKKQENLEKVKLLREQESNIQINSNSQPITFNNNKRKQSNLDQQQNQLSMPRKQTKTSINSEKFQEDLNAGEDFL